MLRTAARNSLGAPVEAGTQIPFLRPDPPRLSKHLRRLIALEQSGVFSNYGPHTRELEAALVSSFFGTGACLTVCNATIGLMAAIREVVEEAPAARVRYALMPSFTFAAAAHAAIWAGLTPLFCDVDPATWLPDARSEEELLLQYGEQIALLLPCATFGNNLDLSRYGSLSERFGVPVVVDAAASLGSLDAEGRQFGSGFKWPIVFSMHATKPFSVGEGGVVYCQDAERIARLRSVTNFGFAEPRIATLPGLNAKMPEMAALTALLQMERFPKLAKRRHEQLQNYNDLLRGVCATQQTCGLKQINSFASVLLPEDVADARQEIRERLQGAGIQAATYFSPHVAEHPYFATRSRSGELRVTADIANRVLSLPAHDGLTRTDVRTVVGTLAEAIQTVRRIHVRGEEREKPLATCA